MFLSNNLPTVVWFHVFISNNINNMVSNNYFRLIIVICLNSYLTNNDNPYSSSSSCHAISIDIPDPLSPPLPIVHCYWQVLRATSSIGTELLHVSSSWMSCLCSSIEGATGVHHIRARPYFSRSVPNVLFV